jgi:hypothetical protein
MHDPCASKRGVVPIVFLSFCLTAVSYASAGIRAEPSGEIDLASSATHYVAVDGDDSGPGTIDHPWATLNHAADVALPGDVVLVRGGRYDLLAQVRVAHSGRPDAWISFIGFPSETPVLDAQSVPAPSLRKAGLDNGAFQIENVSYIRVANLTLVNSHDVGFNVRDSNNIDIVNNTTRGTFSSGIAVWDTNHEGLHSRHIRILGNSVSRATTFDLAPVELRGVAEPPHEAISIGGAIDFEIAYNHVFESDKEGIDIKETSKVGKVHHNLVDHVMRQCLYVDAWFGAISNIDISSNVFHDCRLAGIVLSVEDGHSARQIMISNNLVYDNGGSGLYFSCWGIDGERKGVVVERNTFFHNGYGIPKDGQVYFWMTGGIYLYSTHVRDILIKDNIFSRNRGFQIGYSARFLRGSGGWQEVAAEKAIQVRGNLVDGPAAELPIRSGGDPPDQVDIFPVDGDEALLADPGFRNPADGDFNLSQHSPADGKGFAAGARQWWTENFPPLLFRAHTQ